MSTTHDVYQQVTDQIVRALERGAGAWEKPWSGGAKLPHNVASGKPYRGINVPVLWFTSQDKCYSSHLWGTYNQWQAKGAQVRKGERSTGVVYWGKVQPKAEEGEDEKAPILFARFYNVFNADQVDGFTAPAEAASSEEQRIAHADAFFAATGAKLAHGGDRAFYRPSADTITMPPFASFAKPKSYYGTLAHEHVHWTGAKARCDRDMTGRFGDHAYAMEELVAELGAAFVCADLGIEPVPDANHAAYLQGWLDVLKADKRAIFTVASKAQQAADYLRGFSEAQAIKEAA